MITRTLNRAILISAHQPRVVSRYSLPWTPWVRSYCFVFAQSGTGSSIASDCTLLYFLSYLTLNRIMIYGHQDIAQHIKFASFSSLPSSLPLCSTQPLPSIHPPSPASSPTFPLKFLTLFLPLMPSPAMMLNTTSATYGQRTTASMFVRTLSSAHVVASNRHYASNVCSCTAPPPLIPWR